MGTDVLERQLRDKIASNSKNFIKALHLFDYNRDGRIQKHEMRKVIENYAFRMTDEQYDRWALVWYREGKGKRGVGEEVIVTEMDAFRSMKWGKW